MISLADRFIENFRKARKIKKFSQKDLADKAGISISYVSMLERGQRTPPLDTLEVLAKALGKTPIELLK